MDTSLPLKVEPTFVDFSLHELCSPSSMNISVRFTGSVDDRIEISSYTASDKQFYIPFFERVYLHVDHPVHVFTVMFLAEVLGTSKAIIQIEIKRRFLPKEIMVLHLRGEGIPNSFNLHPLNAGLVSPRMLYSPTITLRNTFSDSTIEISDIYTTEEFVHIRMPPNGIDDWTIPPKLERNIIRVSFQSPIAGSYRGYVRIKTYNSGNFLVPVIVTVVDQGFYSIPRSLDLGTYLRSKLAITSDTYIPISLYNFEDNYVSILRTSVEIADYYSESNSFLISHFKKNIVVPASSHASSAVVLQFSPSKVSDNREHWSGNIVVHTNSSLADQSRFTIPFSFKVVRGSIEVHPTNFAVPFGPKFDQVLKPKSLIAVVKNHFLTPLVILDVAVVAPGWKTNVHIHPSIISNLLGTVLQPEEQLQPIEMQLDNLERTEPEQIAHTQFLKISFNSTVVVEVPITFYSGLLYACADSNNNQPGSASRYGFLHLNTTAVALGTTSTVTTLFSNRNMVQVQVKSISIDPGVGGIQMDVSIEYRGSKQSRQTFDLDPLEDFRLHVNFTIFELHDSAHSYSRTVRIHTNFEEFIVEVGLTVADGRLFVVSHPLNLNHLAIHRSPIPLGPIQVESTFSQPISLHAFDADPIIGIDMISPKLFPGENHLCNVYLKPEFLNVPCTSNAFSSIKDLKESKLRREQWESTSPSFVSHVKISTEIAGIELSFSIVATDLRCSRLLSEEAPEVSVVNIGESFDWKIKVHNPHSSKAVEIKLSVIQEAPPNCFYVHLFQKVVWLKPLESGYLGNVRFIPGYECAVDKELETWVVMENNLTGVEVWGAIGIGTVAELSLKGFSHSPATIVLDAYTPMMLKNLKFVNSGRLPFTIMHAELKTEDRLIKRTRLYVKIAVEQEWTFPLEVDMSSCIDQSFQLYFLVNDMQEQSVPIRVELTSAARAHCESLPSSSRVSVAVAFSVLCISVLIHLLRTHDLNSAANSKLDDVLKVVSNELEKEAELVATEETVVKTSTVPLDISMETSAIETQVISSGVKQSPIVALKQDGIGESIPLNHIESEQMDRQLIDPEPTALSDEALLFRLPRVSPRKQRDIPSGPSSIPDDENTLDRPKKGFNQWEGPSFFDQRTAPFQARANSEDYSQTFASDAAFIKPSFVPTESFFSTADTEESFGLPDFSRILCTNRSTADKIPMKQQRFKPFLPPPGFENSFPKPE